jgi:hypothetical protein
MNFCSDGNDLSIREKKPEAYLKQTLLYRLSYSFNSQV